MQRSAPSMQRSAPSVQRSAPSVQRSAPTAQRSAPSVQRSAPTVQRSTPSVQRSAPTVQRSQPTPSNRPSFADRPSVTGPSRAAEVGRRSGEIGQSRTNVGRPNYDSIDRALDNAARGNRDLSRSADRTLDRTTGRADRTVDRTIDRADRTVDRASRDIGRSTDRAGDQVDRTRDNAFDRAGDRVRDTARDTRLDADGRVRASRDGVTADGRVRGNTGPTRADVDSQLGLRNNRDGAGRNRESRLTSNPDWVNTRSGSRAVNREINSTLASAIGTRDRGDRDFDRGDRDGDRGDRVGDRDGRRGNHDWDRTWSNHTHRWDRWGSPVRNYWGQNYIGRGGWNPWFNNRWFANYSIYRPFGYLNYYGYGGGGYYRPWSYWYGRPNWYGLTGWFGGYGWNSPYYYDYGYGGNVLYNNGGVYVQDTYVGTPVQYAQSAAVLATVNPDDIDQDGKADWLALGTFAMVNNRDQRDPQQVVQLAVDKNGIISGTFFDRDRDEAFAVTGRVDRETQRVAFRIDNNPDIVYETGIYNLTQDQTPILVHDGSNELNTSLLVRLDLPEDQQVEVRE